MTTSEEHAQIELNDPDYYCGKCEKRDVKLWRDVMAVSKGTLRCYSCIVKKIGNLTLEDIDSDGKITTSFGNGTYKHKTDQIGWMIPAVPCPDYCGYWGYTSVPEKFVKWWQKLPNM